MKRRKKSGRPRKGVVPAQLKPYLFGKSTKKKGATVAKKKRKRTKKAAPRRSRRASTARRAPARRRRSSGWSGGSYGSWLPSKSEMTDMGIAYGIGYLEKERKSAAADSFLAKVPTPIKQGGFTGNLAIGLWVLSRLWRKPLVRQAANVAANITTYQLARKAEWYKSGSDVFSISGFGSDDEIAGALDEAAAQIGALSAVPEGFSGTEMAGVSYEPYNETAY